MLKNAVLTEGLKLRGSKIALPIILLPLISVLLGSGNYAVNPHELTNGWYSLWTQFCLAAAIMRLIHTSLPMDGTVSGRKLLCFTAISFIRSLLPSAAHTSCVLKRIIITGTQL